MVVIMLEMLIVIMINKMGCYKDAVSNSNNENHSIKDNDAYNDNWDANNNNDLDNNDGQSELL